ncbi:helix-turn-helix domain-containing protein [Bifidobacterium sp.]|jgi:transcriptional regulator with XRE-family HTH domain|uniref:helix-turn-helix domain-containing protein n=1 Tax=Bifidobacterium sp. TaxID=41200 RepID=UPI0025C01A4C|nr:helix-turn-helix transcriptional regulator [Bifidobacterium sp.]MCI1634598.1 helix-turn-helix transcriptional regulator [Bifidobacterium sp.]
MDTDRRTKELGDFLRAQRARLRPEQFDVLHTERPRRVPGLRREEIAHLVGISVEYYTRIEQGRIPPSSAILDDLSYVMHMNGDQRAYLFRLAQKTVPHSEQTLETIQPPLQRMLDDLATTPAFVIGQRTDIIGWNHLAAAMITDFATIPPTKRNFIRLLFMQPAMRDLYVDWDDVVNLAVARLRMFSAQNPNDPRLLALLKDLSANDRSFDALWKSHEVSNKATGFKKLNHPRVGILELEWQALSPAQDPDQQIIIWTAKPGSQTYHALQRLAALPKP